MSTSMFVAFELVTFTMEVTHISTDAFVGVDVTLIVAIQILNASVVVAEELADHTSGAIQETFPLPSVPSVSQPSAPVTARAVVVTDVDETPSCKVSAVAALEVTTSPFMAEINPFPYNVEVVFPPFPTTSA